MVIGSLLSWLSPPPGHVVIGSLLDFQVYGVMELWSCGLWGYGVTGLWVMGFAVQG